MGKSVATLLQDGTSALEGSSPTPRLDAEVLLAHVLGCEKLQLVLKRNDTVTSDLESKFANFVSRRVQKEPVAYITGKKEFFGRDFKVTKDTLIPRPETEHLVEEAIKFAPTLSQPISILDLGTGTGILITTILLELQSRNIPCSGVATDLWPEALEVAKENALNLGLETGIQFLQGSWWEPVRTLNKKFSIIVTNPPYIAKGDNRVSPETRYEPQSALYSGIDGLDAYRIIIPELSSFLAPGGIFLGEIGFDQRDTISRLCCSMKATIGTDLSGKDRFIRIPSLSTD